MNSSFVLCVVDSIIMRRKWHVKRSFPLMDCGSRISFSDSSVIPDKSDCLTQFMAESVKVVERNRAFSQQLKNILYHHRPAHIHHNAGLLFILLDSLFQSPEFVRWVAVFTQSLSKSMYSRTSFSM